MVDDSKFESVNKRIENALVASTNDPKFFEELDTALSSQLEYDRIDIALYVHRGLCAEYVYVSGVPINGFATNSLLPLSEITAEQLFEQSVPSCDFIEHQPDLAGDCVFTESARAENLNSRLTVPIRWNDVPVGALILHSRKEYAFTSVHVELARNAAGKIAGRVASARDISNLQFESNLRNSLMELSRLTTSSADMSEYQEEFGELICELVGSDRVSISVPHSADQTIDNVLVYGKDIHGVDGVKQSLPFDFSEIPWLNSPNIYIIDEKVMEQSLATRLNEIKSCGSGFKSVLVVPLVWQDAPFAAITFRAVAENAFGRFHIEIAQSIARQLAGTVAIQLERQKTETESRLRRSFLDLVKIASSTDSLDDIQEEFGRLICVLVGADQVALATHDADRELIVNKMVYGHEIEGLTVETETSIEKSGEIPWLDHGEVYLVNSGVVELAGARDRFRDFGAGTELKSDLPPIALPLIISDSRPVEA